MVQRFDRTNPGKDGFIRIAPGAGGGFAPGKPVRRIPSPRKALGTTSKAKDSLKLEMESSTPRTRPARPSTYDYHPFYGYSKKSPSELEVMRRKQIKDFRRSRKKKDF